MPAAISARHKPYDRADGFYTVVAKDLAGNKGTVGRFLIDTEQDGLPTNDEDTAADGTLVGRPQRGPRLPGQPLEFGRSGGQSADPRLPAVRLQIRGRSLCDHGRRRQV